MKSSLTMKAFAASICACLPAVASAEVKIGAEPPAVELKGEEGGRVAGGSLWKSSELKGKVHVLFYVDPDEKDLNEHAAQALKAKEFPLSDYGSVAIINMAASWKPNFAIESALEEKQKEFPHTVYVKDFKKVLVDRWKVQDDSSDVLVFDKEGKVVFVKNGKLSDAEVSTLVQAVDRAIKAKL